MELTRKQLHYELGRHKHKIENQQKEIEKLKETIAGYEQREDINMAMIAAVVEQVGEVVVGRDRISEILDEYIHVIADYDADKRVYTLRMMEVEADGEEGTEDTSC